MARAEGTAAVTPFPKRPAPRRRETDFLPAALEIVETPASPAARAIALLIAAFLAAAIAWAYFGQIDIIATAPGRLVPTGASKVIQPFETGVVRALRVRDGDEVKAGDVLVELDPTSDASDEKRLAFSLAQDRLDMARLNALLDGRAEDFRPPEDVDPRLVAVARRHLQEQAAEQAATRESIDRQIAQKQAEGRAVTAAIDKLTASLPLLSEQRDIRASLLKNEFGSRYLYLQAQQLVVEAQHELEVQRQGLQQNAEALAGLAQRRLAVDAEYRKDLLAALAKAEVQASEHEEGVAKAAQRRGLRTLASPVDGTVQELGVHTLGGVVTPAERLMVIVPRGSGLELQATLANRDVGFVRPGQTASVKIDAFDFTRYGLIEGVIESVSQDAVAPKPQRPDEAGKGDDNPGQPSYVARIRLASKGLETERGFTSLGAGMSVTAEIKTGRRSILAYLLSPLQRTVSEGLRER